MDGAKIVLLACILSSVVSSSQSVVCKAMPGKTCTNAHGSLTSLICCAAILMILFKKENRGA